ncbi:MAG TPA: L-2-amino-thiazoline-4-carboxylic acid hydrolase, partial [Clostridia bacterium]|nr:L-2-amino-thiazoline-4-carboxylic acid hydrolase [Clostridia bacterium]
QTPDSYDMLFDKCGIYNLMKDLGISEITPAMCAYDYSMAKITNTVFTREYTLASGGPVCDCHYQKKN